MRWIDNQHLVYELSVAGCGLDIDVEGVYEMDVTQSTVTKLSDNIGGSVALLRVPEVPLSFTPVSNAGPDQTLTDTDGNGSEQVTLDGSGSSDNSTIVSYSWSENGVEIATGANPQVGLAVGIHTITLTVTDDDGATDTDEVVITVNPGATGTTITITVPPTDGTTLTTQDDTRFQAVAYDPAVGTNDGDGIQGVEVASGIQMQYLRFELEAT